MAKHTTVIGFTAIIRLLRVEMCCAVRVQCMKWNSARCMPKVRNCSGGTALSVRSIHFTSLQGALEERSELVLFVRGASPLTTPPPAAACDVSVMLMI